MAINKRLIAGAPTGGGGACTTNTLQILGDSSCIAYYKMADATDESGSYNGTPTSVDFNVEGKYGLAGKFNGSSSQINTGVGVANQSFSISMWINDPDPSSWDYIWGTTGSGAVLGYSMNVANNKIDIILRNSSGQPDIARAQGGTISSNTWHNIVFTHDDSGSGTNTFYIDGVQPSADLGSLPFTGKPPSNSTSIYLGSSGSYNVDRWDGKIDQVRIFNKALSASEVGTLYNEVQCASAVTPSAAFSTITYAGTSGVQSTNSLSSQSGTVNFEPSLVWIKARNFASSNALFDSVRGTANFLSSNTTTKALTTSDDGTLANTLTSFNSNGFSLGTDNGQYGVNASGKTYVAWNWYAPTSETNNAGSNGATSQSIIKKNVDAGFSIVKYTGNQTDQHKVYHGLGAIPQVIILKCTGATNPWYVYHEGVDESSPADFNLRLNTTDPRQNSSTEFSDTPPTANLFTLGTTAGTNKNSTDYIAYVFAQKEGYSRFGSYVGNDGVQEIVTGFEPAWIMYKAADSAGKSWAIRDNKRNADKISFADLANIEETKSPNNFIFTTNGFQLQDGDSYMNGPNVKYVFMAFAQDPDTTPATKADSFDVITYTGNGGTQSTNSLQSQSGSVSFKPDFTWIKSRSFSQTHSLFDSIRGPSKELQSDSTSAEDNSSVKLVSFDSNGFTLDSDAAGRVNENNETFVAWNWKAADHDRSLATINQDGSITSLVSANVAGGFSIVKYTGDGGSSKTIGHGLTTQPNLVIFKRTDASVNWFVFFRPASGNTIGLEGLNTSSGAFSTNYTTFQPSTTTMTTSGSTSDFNGSGNSYIMYNFVNVAGYQKIGSYIGTGNAGLVEQVGFTPSFLLVKRTDAAGGIAKGWFLLDNKRNTSNPRNTSLEAQGAFADNTLSSISFDFDATSFKINGTNRQVNEANGNYIYLAIA